MTSSAGSPHENVAPNVTKVTKEAMAADSALAPATSTLPSVASSLGASSSAGGHFRDSRLTSLLSLADFIYLRNSSNIHHDDAKVLRILYANLLVLVQTLGPVASNAPAEMPRQRVIALQAALDRAYDFLKTIGKAQSCAYVKRNGQLELDVYSNAAFEYFAAYLFTSVSGAIAPQLHGVTAKRRHLQLLLGIGLNLGKFTDMWGMQCTGETATEAVTLFTALLKRYQEAMSYLPFEEDDCTFKLTEKTPELLGGYRDWVVQAAEDEMFVRALQPWVNSGFNGAINKEEEEVQKKGEVPVDVAYISKVLAKTAGGSLLPEMDSGVEFVDITRNSKTLGEAASAILDSNVHDNAAQKQMERVVLLLAMEEEEEEEKCSFASLAIEEKEGSSAATVAAMAAAVEEHVPAVTQSAAVPIFVIEQPTSDAEMQSERVMVAARGVEDQQSFALFMMMDLCLNEGQVTEIEEVNRDAMVTEKFIISAAVPELMLVSAAGENSSKGPAAPSKGSGGGSGRQKLN